MTLGGEAGAVLDAAALLIDKSLLQQTEQEGGEPRLVMLETIREYGLECLVASGEVEATRHAHAAYYLQLAEAAPDRFGAGEQAWIDRLEREHDNLRGAMNWLLEHREARGRIEMTLRLSAALWWFWLLRGHRHEGWTFLERALAGSESAAEPVRAKALWLAMPSTSWRLRPSTRVSMPGHASSWRRVWQPSRSWRVRRALCPQPEPWHV